MTEQIAVDRLEKMSAFIDKFRKLNSGNRQLKLDRMRSFISRFDDEYPELRKIGIADFNLFTLFSIGTDEVKQSKFLAWLIDADAGHKQGSIFLESLLKLCEIDIPLKSLRRYRVQTEYSGLESRIDVLIYSKGKFVIYLENKVFASEGIEQIDREIRDMHWLSEMLHVPKSQRFAIFLTPSGKKPISGDAANWKSISYSAIAYEFEKILPNVTGEKVKLVLTDWIMTVLKFGGSRYDIYT